MVEVLFISSFCLLKISRALVSICWSYALWFYTCIFRFHELDILHVLYSDAIYIKYFLFTIIQFKFSGQLFWLWTLIFFNHTVVKLVNKIIVVPSWISKLLGWINTSNKCLLFTLDIHPTLNLVVILRCASLKQKLADSNQE